MSNKTSNVPSPIGGGTIINEYTYKSIYDMLNSRDAENHLMAQRILITCDVQASIYWIWQLARKTYASNMVNLRTKLGRKFRDDTYLFGIAYMHSYNFMHFLGKKDDGAGNSWLTPEIFAKLEKDTITFVKDKSNNVFYDITITLKPEFHKYAQDVKPINLTKYED